MADLGWGAGGIQDAITSAGQLQQQQQSAALFSNVQADADLTVQQKQVALASSKIQLQQQQTQLAMLTGAAGAKMGASPADMLETIAHVDLASGDLNGARESLATADTLRKNQSDISARNLETQNKLWGDIGNMLGGVKDTQSFNQAKLLFATAHPDEAKDPNVQKLLQQNYSPELVQRLSTLAQTQLQKAQTDQANARATAATQETKTNELRDKLIQAQTTEAEARTKRLEKVGGQNLAPKPADVQAITDQMAQDYGDLADADQTQDFRERAQGAAQRLVELQKEGIPKAQAAKQAYAEAKQAGDFGGLKKRSAIGAPSSAANPRPVPTDGKLQDNQYYRNAKGQVGLYHAETNTFTPVGQ